VALSISSQLAMATPSASQSLSQEPNEVLQFVRGKPLSERDQGAARFDDHARVRYEFSQGRYRGFVLENLLSGAIT
jgi:hypothetical protein